MKWIFVFTFIMMVMMMMVNKWENNKPHTEWANQYRHFVVLNCTTRKLKYFAIPIPIDPECEIIICKFWLCERFLTPKIYFAQLFANQIYNLHIELFVVVSKIQYDGQHKKLTKKKKKKIADGMIVVAVSAFENWLNSWKRANHCQCLMEWRKISISIFKSAKRSKRRNKIWASANSSTHMKLHTNSIIVIVAQK